MNKCSYEDCEEDHYSRGWCKRHYQRWWRTGTPDGESAEQRKLRLDAQIETMHGRLKRGLPPDIKDAYP